jgi:hypothetical protein
VAALDSVVLGVGDARDVDELVAHVDKGVALAFAAQVKSKMRAYQANASSMSATSIATWLMPISFGSLA